ncbi:hypothetical protein RUND412_002036 [Rhizina undulata]
MKDLLGIEKRVYGKERRQTLEMMGDLAIAYRERNRLYDAVETWNDLLDITKRVYATYSWRLQRKVDELEKLNRLQKRLDDAATIANDLLAVEMLFKTLYDFCYLI